MKDMPTSAEVVRKLLPLLDSRDVAVILMDLAELLPPAFVCWRDSLHLIGAELLATSRPRRNPAVAPAEQGYPCQDVEPCS